MKHLFFLAFFLFIGKSFSQNVVTLSDSARISLMTVAPGEFLYSTFGHQYYRVLSGTD